jgi:hypothetical protein
MSKVVFVFGENGQIFSAFDKQSGECLADDLFRTKGQRAVVLEAFVNFDAAHAQIVGPVPEHQGYGINSENERLKDVPRWRRWLHRL